MEIERAITTVALKIGKKVWSKGEVFFPPFSAPIRNEIKHETGTLKVFYKRESSPSIVEDSPLSVEEKPKAKPVKRKPVVKKEKKKLVLRKKKKVKAKTSAK